MWSLGEADSLVCSYFICNGNTLDGGSQEGIVGVVKLTEMQLKKKNARAT